MSAQTERGVQWKVSIHSIRHCIVSCLSFALGADDVKQIVAPSTTMKTAYASLRIWTSAWSMQTLSPTLSARKPDTLLRCKCGVFLHSVHILGRLLCTDHAHLPADASSMFGVEIELEMGDSV